MCKTKGWVRNTDITQEALAIIFSFFFWMWIDFRVFIECALTLPLLLGREASWILAPGPEIEYSLPALEDEVLTTGPPWKSLSDNPRCNGP